MPIKDPSRYPDNWKQILLDAIRAQENLRAWCQRCHNTYDAPFRRMNRRIALLQKRVAELEGRA